MIFLETGKKKKKRQESASFEGTRSEQAGPCMILKHTRPPEHQFSYL